VRRAQRRRLVITLCAMVAIAIAAGEWAAFAGAGGRAARHAHAGAVAAPRGGQGASRVVRLVVEASGDLLIHSAIFERALVLGGGRHYNFAPMFAQIRPYIRRADLALCHVETPMTPAPPAGYPVFNTPPALATAIGQTGWWACSTAATHTLDQGQNGVDGTIRALDRLPGLHRAHQRHPLAASLVGQPGQRRADLVRRPPRPPGRRAGGHR
jgi:Bacterial capsule synthesis protein PGA_cap